MVATKAAPTAEAIGPRLWTRKECERMARLGVFGVRERTELIDGVIYRLTPQNSRHTATLQAAAQVLRDVFSDACYVREQAPLALGELSEPEPDVAVVVGRPVDYLAEHPREAILVEVANTSIAHDRRIKTVLYARAANSEYWILNLKATQLEVHRHPSSSSHKNVAIVKRGDSISPLSRPERSVPVADLLP
jgi:Uma2 family endonuclease